MTAVEEITSTTTATVEVKPHELADMLHNLLVVTSKDKTRPILCAVNVTVADGSLIGEATDSYMLLRQEVSLSEETRERKHTDGTILTPASTETHGMLRRERRTLDPWHRYR